MKKAIVTGATGFIGRALVKELLAHGIQVYAIVRPNSRNIKYLSKHNLLQIISCDLQQLNTLLEKIVDRDIDVIYHLAWEGTSGDKTRNGDIQLVNISSTLKLADLATTFGVKRFIGAGSIYEEECLIEMKEEKPVINLVNIYKTAKLTAHFMAKVKICTQSIDFIWPIITNVYGEGEFSQRLINSTIRKIYNGESVELTLGDQYYDFIYISDAAKALYNIGESGKNCERYVLGSGFPRPLKSFLQELGNIVDDSVLLKFGSSASKAVYLPKEIFCSTTLKRDTHFVPEISFQEGVFKTAQWIKKINDIRD